MEKLKCESCRYFAPLFGNDKVCGTCNTGGVTCDIVRGATMKECEIYESKKRDKHDAVSPSHYKQGGIECKDCIKAALGEHYIGFLIGNVIKYTYRYQHKNGVEDLKKAAVYLDWAIKELSNDEE